MTELLIMKDFHFGVLSQLKPSELYILSFEKDLGLRPLSFSKLRM